MATKQAQAAALASPTYDNPFYLDVSDKGGIINVVLFQKKEGGRQVLMYYSSILDNIEKGQARCIHYLATLAKAIGKTSHIIMCHPLKVNMNRGVVAFLGSRAFTFSLARKKLNLCHPNTTAHLIWNRRDEHGG